MHRGCARDLLILTAVAVVSVVPYVSRIGFYSDDWAIFAILLNASDESFSGYFTTLMESGTRLGMRPMVAAYHAGLTKAFGLNPLGYHLCNAVVITSLPLFLYLVLREVPVHRTVALAVAAVYVQLPNYSTDRFWMAAFGYGLSTALFLIGVYAFLKAVRGRRVAAWLSLALAALGGASLGMEVVLSVALAIPLAVWWRLKQVSQQRLREFVREPRALLLLCSLLFLAAGVILFKFRRVDSSIAIEPFYIVRLAVGSVATNFGSYGIALPHTVLTCSHVLSWSAAVVAAVLAVVIFSWLVSAEAPPDSPRFWTMLVLAGGGVFALGLAIFVITPKITYWSTGIANRVWIAASLGVALVLVGFSGLIVSRLSDHLRRWIFAGVITVVCVSHFLVNTALSTYWAAAWPRQLAVLNDIRKALPDIPPRTTVILHGVCPYLGPAPVFESPWDLAGALQVAYRDPTLRADVTTGRFSIGQDAISTRIYDISKSYRYGPDLLLFDHQQKTIVPLTDAQVARAQLARLTDCPAGIASGGTLVLPFDTWYRNLEAKGFRPWR